MKCNESSWFQVNQLKACSASKVIAGGRSNLEYSSLEGMIQETEGSKNQRISVVADNTHLILEKASQVTLVVKNMPGNAGDIRDPGSIPGLGRSPGEGNDNPLQYSCLRIPMDRRAWWVTVHGAVKSRTRLKQRSAQRFLLMLNYFSRGQGCSSISTG